MTVVCLTGCGNIETYITDYGATIANRVTKNLEQVDRLEQAGIITSSVADSLREAINSNLDRFGVNSTETNEDGSVDTSSATSILSGIKDSVVEYGSDITAVKNELGTPADGPQGLNVVAVDGDDKTGTGDNGVTEISNLINLQIYVLKKATVADGDSPYNTFIDVNEILNAGAIGDNITSGGSVGIADESVLSEMFIDSGRVILDPADDNNSILKDTEPPATVTATYLRDGWSSYTEDKPPDPPNTMGTDLVLRKLDTEKDDETGIIYYKIPTAIQVRLHEFNVDAIDKIVGKDNVAKDIYYIKNNKCYLMEYPVFYVSGFETNDGVNFIPQYTMSDLQVNILTGQVHFRDGSLVTNDSLDRYKGINSVGGSSFVLDGVSRYGITADDSHNESDIDSTSTTQLEANTAGYKSWYKNYISNYGEIAFSDEAKASTNADIKNAAAAAETAYNSNLSQYGSIVLRDYLEYTYMPGVVSGENLVALGRMLRLNKFAGKVTEDDNGIIGEFVGKYGVPQSDISGTVATDENGNIIEQAQSGVQVSIRDVMAIKPAQDGKAVKLKFNAYSGGSSETESSTEGATEATTESAQGTADLFSVESKTLTREYTNRLVYNRESGSAEGYYVSFRFPSVYVARSDMSTLSTSVQSNNSGDGSALTGSKLKPVMYGMALDLTVFGSNMYSTWLNVDDDGGDFGSLNWWNSWLQTSQYTYQIDKNKVLESISGAYSFDVTGNGYIILDLETISKLQDMYNVSDRYATINFWRTILVIVGFFCIILSVILPVAWLYDTNIVVGPRILTLVTLGKWVAVTESYTTDELRLVSGDTKQPMTFPQVLYGSFVIMVVGLLLCFIDPIKIIDFIIVLFGLIGSFIENALTGM